MVTIEGSIYTSALFLVALIGVRVSSLRFRGSRLMGTVVAAFGTPALAWATDTLNDVNGVSRTVRSAAALARSSASWSGVKNLACSSGVRTASRKAGEDMAGKSQTERAA